MIGIIKVIIQLWKLLNFFFLLDYIFVRYEIFFVLRFFNLGYFVILLYLKFRQEIRDLTVCKGEFNNGNISNQVGRVNYKVILNMSNCRVF